ncbi:restriction endonuclease subunit S [Streptomyces zaomyceticus]|uniref:restriction endonuclease subunit S n=1 Tax=Streptomyces zaomyceticus TaxID=68286 RepID=UPI003712689B
MSWPTAPLKRMVDPTRPITYGIVQAGPDTPGGIPYIRPVDMTQSDGVPDAEKLQRTTHEIAQSYRRSTVAAGDIVVSIGPSYGKTMVVPSVLAGANLTQGTARVAPAKNISTRYLYWTLQSAAAKQFWDSSVGGATFRALNLEPLGRTPVPLVPLAEQRRIADFLDAETSRLDGLARTQALLIERLKEREGVAIELTLFDASSRRVRLKRMLTAPMSYGANESTEHNRRDWPRYVRTTDIANDGTLRDETFASLPPDVAQNYMLRDGDLLFVRSGATVGKSFVYESQYGPAAHAGYLIRARVNSDLTLPRLIWYFCQTATYWQQVGEGAIQATIQNVNAEKYGNLLVPLVDRDRQDSTLAILDSQLAKSRILKNRAEQLLELLAERRQALITAAVTGQFDVSTASGRNVTDGVSA